MSRESAIDAALEWFDEGGFLETLAERVAVPTESQNPERLPELARYLDEQMIPAFEAMGFETHVYPNPVAGGGPVLLAMSLVPAMIWTTLGCRSITSCRKRSSICGVVWPPIPRP